MKPYIEYEGKTYEFEGNFQLQKEFKKEYRQLLAKGKNKIMSAFANNELNLQEISEVQKELEDVKKELDGKNLSKEELETLVQEKTMGILNNHPEILKLLNADQDESQEETEELNEKYCRLMFARKYPDEKEVFDKFIEEVCQDKGIDYVEQLFSAIVNEVFTNVVNEAPLQKPSFAWETNKTTN